VQGEAFLTGLKVLVVGKENRKPVVQFLFEDPWPTDMGRAKDCRRKQNRERMTALEEVKRIKYTPGETNCYLFLNTKALPGKENFGK